MDFGTKNQWIHGKWFDWGFTLKSHKKETTANDHRIFSFFSNVFNFNVNILALVLKDDVKMIVKIYHFVNKAFKIVDDNFLDNVIGPA